MTLRMVMGFRMGSYGTRKQGVEREGKKLLVASCPAGSEARNSFIIERVSGTEVFNGISVFR